MASWMSSVSGPPISKLEKVFPLALAGLDPLVVMTPDPGKGLVRPLELFELALG